MEEHRQKTDEEVKREFYKTLAGYFSVKSIPTGFYNTVGSIRDKLEILNENIDRANESSTKLSAALNRITTWGVVIGGAGVAVAIGHLILEIIKYWTTVNI